MAERVAENLNRALHELFATSSDMYLLGQDVLDPYGGAFKVTRGLSTAYPDRVLSTPISENAMVGVASGLALRGNGVVVEFMFGDFLLLALDPIVNFAAKSVSMYGQPVPLRLLLRCPVGGNRGYGATHSQSVQKFLVGVPDLGLWEMSPFIDASRIMRQMLETRRPGVLFEDKVLYTQRMFEAGQVHDNWNFEEADSTSLWTVIQHREGRPPDVVIIAAGGTAHRCLAAASQLRDQHGISATVAVPARLYPCDPDPVLPALAAAGRVLLVEEGTPGGSWSGELAQQLHSRLWSDLLAPAAILTSQDSVIPAARHLEQEVLVTTEDVVRGVVKLRDFGAPRTAARLARKGSTGPAAAHPHEANGGAATADGANATEPIGAAVVLPHLNANEEGALLIEWLVADGDEVACGQPVAVVETAKASSELEAPAAGRIRLLADAGTDQPFGSRLATVIGPLSAEETAESAPPPQPAVDGHQARQHWPISGAAARERHRPAQLAVATAVSRSHQTIPPAFAARDVAVDQALAYLDDIRERTGAPIDLGPFLIGALARLHPRHPDMFAAVAEDGTAATSSAADVAVTIDAGNGLYLPVIRAAGAIPLDALADRLVELQMAALSGCLTAADLDTTGVGLAVSLNLSSGVDLVQPLIMPGMSCIVSVAAVRPLVRLDTDGTPTLARQVTLGVAHDHRVVNGRPAMEMLADLAACFDDPEDTFGGACGRRKLCHLMRPANDPIAALPDCAPQHIEADRSDVEHPAVKD
jgi:pyruvate/2-oxoglutarate/acetoin dehydrogenase E1 component/pyruvate/2-oxoglutarate dehydrogenase complex dihydrolipoamide acyltransferase (E2) component